MDDGCHLAGSYVPVIFAVDDFKDRCELDKLRVLGICFAVIHGFPSLEDIKANRRQAGPDGEPRETVVTLILVIDGLDMLRDIGHVDLACLEDMGKRQILIVEREEIFEFDRGQDTAEDEREVDLDTYVFAAALSLEGMDFARSYYDEVTRYTVDSLVVDYRFEFARYDIDQLEISLIMSFDDRSVITVRQVKIRQKTEIVVVFILSHVLVRNSFDLSAWCVYVWF